ncbi:intraflagellar transport protein 43 [Pycnococcus provasolii]
MADDLFGDGGSSNNNGGGVPPPRARAGRRASASAASASASLSLAKGPGLGGGPPSSSSSDAALFSAGGGGLAGELAGSSQVGFLGESLPLAEGASAVVLGTQAQESDGGGVSALDGSPPQLQAFAAGGGGGGGPVPTAGGFMSSGAPPANVGDGTNEDGKFTGVSRRKSIMLERQAVEASKAQTGFSDRAPNRSKHEDMDTTDILEIPELEEEDEEEDLTRQVAAPPRLLRRNVQTMKELDSDIAFNIPIGGGKGQTPEVDLSLLTAKLLPSDAVQEDHTLWDYDQLHQEVAQDISAAERAAELEDEAAAGGGVAPALPMPMAAAS